LDKKKNHAIEKIIYTRKKHTTAFISNETMSMTEVTEDLPDIQCDCDPDAYPKYLGHIKDGVLHTPVQLSTQQTPKRKKAAKKKEVAKNKVPKLKLDLSKIREIPPVIDEKGEYSEVQVLEEFNPDEILSNLYNPPHCPRCIVPMSYGSVRTPDGGK